MEERLAGDYVDACRADVRAAVAGMQRPAGGEGLDAALHRSVAVLLHRQMRRLLSHNPQVSYLPEELHAEIGKWKSALSRNDCEPVVKQRASQWQRALVELLQQLERDWAQLVAYFGLDPQATMVAISEPLGDPHRDGRAVFKVVFDDGHALIYKPRPVDTEYTFGRLVEWLQQNGCEPALAWCRVLPCDGYGWTEFVEPIYCRTAEEAERYYERQGAFLALFFLLRGGDCIGENVVGHGDHPIWVDVECVCRPEFVEREPLPPHMKPLAWIGRSILSTALVFHGNAAKIPPRRVTALGVSCVEDRSTVFTEHDIMRDRYVRAVQKGFRSLYGWMLMHKAAWTTDGMAVSCWRHQKVRIIPRPTMLYAALTDWLCVAPASLRGRILRDLEQTLQAFGERRPWSDALVPAELRALERGDVPHWSIATDSRDVQEAGGTVLRGLARRTGLECLLEHASQMNEADMETQVWLIDGFLRVRAAA